MASQIEQTLTSLTALSELYTAQLDDYFMKRNEWFQDFRSSTLTRIKTALHRIDSRALASRSPVKSLRKKTRRKPKKPTRARKNKTKPDVPLPIFNDRSLGSDVRNSNDTSLPSFVSPPAQLLTPKESSVEKALEVPPHLNMVAFQSKPTESPEADNHIPGKHTSAAKRLSSKRFTRSTASFQSAVESPILGPRGHQSNHEEQCRENPVQALPRARETSESQWEDCRSKPEPAPLRGSKGSAANKRLELDRIDLVDEDTPKKDAKSRTVLARGDELSPTDSNVGDIEAQSSAEEPRETASPVRWPSDAVGIDHEKNPPDPNTAEEKNSKNRRPESVETPATDGEDDEATPTFVRRRKRASQSPYMCSPKLEDGIRNSSRNSSSVEAGQRTEVLTGTDDHHLVPLDMSSGEGSSKSRSLRSGFASAADGRRNESKEQVDFEFKAPKPRPAVTHSISASRQGAISPAGPRTSEVHQTPKAQTRSKGGLIVPKHITVFQNHFAVDEGGKIDDTGIGLLSEIASTPASASRENEPGTVKEGEGRVLRGTKLFKPTEDIYSAQRKPALTRGLAVQKSNMSTRASLLSHTPGAHAPTTRLAKHSILMGPSSSSLRESIAALKQPITESKPTLPKPEGELNSEPTWNSQPQSLLHSDSQDPRILVGGKRLTFADVVKQFDGTRIQPARALEPQTAPTKEFRQPRIGRDREKSALRRRIEEIRGKASTSTVTNDTSPRSSPDKSMQGSLSEQNLEAGKSDAKALDSPTTMEQATRKSEQAGASHIPESEIVCNTVKPPNEAAYAVLSADSVIRNHSETEQVPEHSHEPDGSSAEQEPAMSVPRPKRSPISDGKSPSRKAATGDNNEDETDGACSGETEGTTEAPKSLLSNLMTSVTSLYPVTSSLLGVRTNEERREETDAEVAAKRQKLDAERREAERLARIEAQRAIRQKEAEEKQRRAESRRQLLAEAEKAKEDERKRKEDQRKRVKLVEEEQRKRKKLEEDKKKSERRRQVLEKKAINMEMQARRKAQEGKRQRHLKLMERGTTGIPKPSALGGKNGKPSAIPKTLGKVHSPTSSYTETEHHGLPTGKNIGRAGEENHREIGTTSYVMTPAKSTVIEESDDEKDRRRNKMIPKWAGDRNLEISTRSQPDPDKVFVNMPMCNLRDVFGTEKQYRTRSSSANWTQDRVTTAEMTKYKKAVGGFRDV